MVYGPTWEAIELLDRLYQVLLGNPDFRALMTIYRFYPQDTGKMLEMINSEGDLVEVHRGDSFISVVSRNISLDLTNQQLLEELRHLIDFAENYHDLTPA